MMTQNDYVYLDNSATTRPLRAVREAMEASMQLGFANPSSLHTPGAQAEERLEEDRQATAELLGARPEEIIFTSGATEANNTALRCAFGAYRHRGNHIVTTAVEHPSVLRVCAALEEEGAEVSYLPADREGRIDHEHFRATLRGDTVLCSIMAVNNEVGSVQPLREVASAIADRPAPRPLLHIDAVQAVGWMDFQPSALGCDLASLSAHKFHGPKGAGALYLRRGLQIPPLLAGGGQERGLRSGTENTTAISGAAVAARWLTDTGRGAYRRLRTLRWKLALHICDRVPQAHINGPGADANEDRGAPHILSVSFPGLPGEVLVHALAERQIYASTGAACSSRGSGHPGTLQSMPVEEGVPESAIRLSLSPRNTQEEIEYTAEVLADIVPTLLRMSGRGG